MSSTNDDVEDGSKPVVLIPVGQPRTRGGLRVQHLIYMTGACAVLFWMGREAGILLVFVVVATGCAGVAGLAVVLVRRNVMQQESLLWALAIAAERSLPLPPAALAFADQYGWWFRGRVEYLAALIDQGATLPEALKQVPGLISREAAVLVRTGWASGTVGRALREAAGLRATRQAAWGDVVARLAYLAVACLFMQVVTVFILYFVAPRYEAIFRDFGVPLPAMTVFTLRAGRALTDWWGLPLAFLVLSELAALLLIPLSLSDPSRWNVPPIDALFRRRHTTVLLRALALSVGGGKPVTPALGVLAREYPSYWVRERLRRVDADVRDGRDWADALGDRGLIRPADAAVFASAQRAGNLEWALRELADSAERRTGYRLQFLTQSLFPVAILCLGAVVFVMAVAYFAPLVRLIEVLAG